jgi:hypothetical protein
MIFQSNQRIRLRRPVAHPFYRLVGSSLEQSLIFVSAPTLFRAAIPFANFPSLDIEEGFLHRRLTLSSMIFGPTDIAPHLAVSEIRARMPLRPARCIRSTMNFNSCTHSKYAISGW